MPTQAAAPLFAYRVQDAAGNYLASWQDASAPDIQASYGGVRDITVTFPRRYGASDEPGEPGSAGALAHGNTVTVSAIGDNADELTIFLGTIKGTAWDEAGAQVRLLHGHRALREAVEPAYTTNTTISYLANAIALGVATAASAGGGGLAASMRLHQMSRAQAGRKLADAAGVRYWIHQDGTPVFGSLTAQRRHDLGIGREIVAGWQLEKSTDEVYTRVLCYYAGSDVPQTAGVAGEDFIYPRTDITTPGAALAAATGKLAQLSGMRLGGKVKVTRETYPQMDTLQVGDLVRVHIERRLATGAGFVGYNDYNDKDAEIVAIRYTPRYVELTLATAATNAADILAVTQQELKTIAAQLADRAPARLVATPGQLTYAELLEFAGGVTPLPPGMLLQGDDWIAPAGIDAALLAAGAAIANVGAGGVAAANLAPGAAAVNIGAAGVTHAMLGADVVEQTNIAPGAVDDTEMAPGAALGNIGTTAGAADLNKTTVAAWAGGATANPQQAAVDAPASKAADTINAYDPVNVPGDLAARLSDVQTLEANMRNHVNNALKAAIDDIRAALSGSNVTA